MKNRIVLIYPEGRLDGNYPNRKGHAYAITPPINLLSVAGFLLEAGYRCEILDAKVEDFRPLEFDDVLCVGISSMSGMQLRNGTEIAAFVRSSAPGIPIVWGGVHPSLAPESTAKHHLVDLVVRGEGEETMVELADRLRDGEGYGDVLGISYKDDRGQVVHNPDRPFMDMDKIGILPYELVDLSKYPLNDTGFPLNTSRGCPYPCKFCYNLTYNKRKWRAQSPENVMVAIRHIIEKYGIRHFLFQVDDEFFINKERVEKICTTIVDEELGIKWSSFNRADILARYSPEFMQLLKDSGCKELFIGGESGSRRMLEFIAKKIDPEDIIEASRKCSEFGIVPIISFMTAFPGETQKDRDETFALIDRINDVNPDSVINGIFSYSPYPGTPLFETAMEYGLKELETMEDWMHFQYDDVRKIPWLSRGEKSKLFTICKLARFPFLSSSPEFPAALRFDGHKGIRKIKIAIERLGYVVLWQSSRIRWKYKLFSFAPEWKLWGWYLIKNNVW